MSDEEIDVRGPGGLGFRLTGPRAALLYLVMLVLGMLGYINWTGFARLEDLQAKSVQGHIGLRSDIREMTCILSLSDQERKDLRHSGGTRASIRSYCPWLEDGQ